MSVLLLLACSKPTEEPVGGEPAGAVRLDLGGVVPRTIVVVQVDTLREDATPWGGSERDTFPYMGGRDGWVYVDHAVAEATWTAPSTASLMTGAGQELHGVRAFPDNGDPFPSVRIETWPARFHAAGWETGLFTGSDILNNPDLALGQGFDTVTIEEQEPGNADGLFGKMAGWLRKREADQSVLVFVQPVDPHGPYRSVDRDVGTWVDPSELPFDPDDPNEIQAQAIESAVAKADAETRALLLDEVRRAYDEQLLDLDRSLRSIFAVLDEDDRLDDAVVVLTSDHGESFYDGVPEWLGHGAVIRHEIVHVPLAFWSPATSTASLDCVASNLDVFPTLVAAAGLEPLADRPGQSLLDGCREQAFSAVYENDGTGDRLTWVGVESSTAAQARECGGATYGFDLAQDPHALVDVGDVGLDSALDTYVEQIEAAFGPVECASP